MHPLQVFRVLEGLRQPRLIAALAADVHNIILDPPVLLQQPNGWVIIIFPSIASLLESWLQLLIESTSASQDDEQSQLIPHDPKV